MSLVPSLSVFRTWSRPYSPARAENTAAAEDGAGDQPFPSTALPTLNERRLALAMVLASLMVFGIAVPFVTHTLPEYWAFIPAYQSALAINDLITATLLFTQFSILRSPALLVLACGYLFTFAMVVIHGLSFPGLFAPSGLLGAGPQTTAWLYMFWHGGFPLAVIVYARFRDEKGGGPAQVSARAITWYAIGAVWAAVVAVTLLTTSGHALLPAIMQGAAKAPAMTAVVSMILLLTLAALIEVWRKPRHTTLDLWLLVTMCAWLFDIALSAALNGQRFDVGFYAGRLYGLAAATFVLVVLLTKTGALYAKMSRLLSTEQLERRRESGLRRRIFDTSLDLIFVADRRGTLIQVSPSSEAILGYHPTEMMEHGAIHFVYPADLEHTRYEMRKARRGSPIRNFDCRYVHKDGRVVPLSWKGVWSEPDQQHFFVGRDMTERLALEQQLRHAQKMEAIGQLTGGIAHDFNNILAVIIGMTELTAAAVAKDPNVSAMVKQIDESAERGALLVQRMLAFARKQPLETRVLDLNEAVKHVVAILERTIAEHITLQPILADDLWPGLADPSQLQDAIVNLAVNARDAMPNGGRLLIETANVHLDEAYARHNAEVVVGDYISINVTDSGAGIPADILERVFEPFFTTKEVGRGTGLGLSMVYGFVKQSRGHVKIYSEVGHGTSVRLYLPRAMQEAPSRKVASADTSIRLPSGSETILVVEDDASVRAMAMSTLQHLGYNVRQASNGKSALEILHEPAHIDLLFTDMIMPNGMSGYDLIRAARQIRPSIKLLLTSGYSEQFIKSADNAPDVRLLGKPYRGEKLATIIRATLDGNG